MSADNRIHNVILADDHPLLLKGLNDVVSADNNLAVVGVASDGLAALALIRQLQPELAVLDLAMPGLNGLEVARTVAAEGGASQTVLLTALITDEQVVHALAAGVSGILLKESALDQLTTCLHAVANGGNWLPAELVERALAQYANRSRQRRVLRDVLTTREREIVELVCQGHGNNWVAEALGLSPGTVRIHLHNIYTKLDVKNRTALTALVLKDRGE